MFKMLRRTALVAALALGAVTVTSTAEARDRYYRHHDGDRTGAAIAGGVIGLALGAAIASSGRHSDYYYDGGYYYGHPRGYYGYPRIYYYRSNPRHYYRHYRPRHHYRGDGWRGRYRGW